MGDSSSKMAAPVILNATGKHSATVIFLHGLSGTGHGWVSAMGEVSLPHIKVICPTAPVMPVTLCGGIKMPSWFEVVSLESDGPEDTQGIKAARDYIHQLIAQEVQSGIPSSRIMLCGFSQGGGLALYSAFTHKEPLAGVIALSCWLPLRAEFPQGAVGNTNIAILQCHGDCDPVVPYLFGQITSCLIKKFAPNIHFKTYPGMKHSSCESEMKAVKAFIREHLPSL